MKITDSSPETQGTSMQSFHPPLFKQQTKGRDATRTTELWPECFCSPGLTASNNREHTSNQSVWNQELEKTEAS